MGDWLTESFLHFFVFVFQKTSADKTLKKAYLPIKTGPGRHLEILST